MCTLCQHSYKCVRLLLYIHGQHINVCICFIDVEYGHMKRFEVAISLNHDIMTSF